VFNLVPFLTYAFVATFTPGPNNIMALSNGSNYGYKKTLPFIFGMVSGFAVVLLLSSYLNLALFNLIPKIKPFMYILGACFMVYLAVKVLLSKPHADNKNSTNNFLTGFSMQFINPKGILFGLTVTSSFIIPVYQTWYALLLFSLFLASIGFAATSSWTLFGAMFNKFLSKYQKPFNIVMAILLIYSAVSIILELF
jgi:cysteine/O-acetylserine efflux protein